MRIFISGGCKNGKSTTAQRLAVAQRQPGGMLYYLATMSPTDSEDEARIARHQQERAGMGFITIECPCNILSVTARLTPKDSLLLDSLTALLANELFPVTGIDPSAPQRVQHALSVLYSTYPNVVVVSDFLYADSGCYGAETELYRRSLAALDRCSATACDTALELCAGNIITHKGALPLEATR